MNYRPLALERLETRCPLAADLAVVVEDLADPVVSGDTLDYRITVSNLGLDDAENTVLSNTIPANVIHGSFIQSSGPPYRIASFDGAMFRAYFSLIPAGATAVFSMQIRVFLDTPDGTVLTNTASVESSTPDSNVTNNSAVATTEIRVVDLEVVQEAVPDPVLAGKSVAYTITVANLGSAAAESVQWSHQLDARTTLQSVSLVSGPSFALAIGSTGPIVGRIESLPGGAASTYQVVVKVNSDVASGTLLTSAATISNSKPDQGVSNNSAFVTTTVIVPGSARLADDPLSPGEKRLLVVGTKSNDTLVVAPRSDQQVQVLMRNTGRLLGIYPRAAFHRIVAHGLGGHDLILVDARIDKLTNLYGNAGNDYLAGGRWVDWLYGGEGNDTLVGRDGNDRLWGGRGDDFLFGGNGHDQLYGELGKDAVYGGFGRDLLVGGEHRDRLFGQDGDDILIGGTTAHDEIVATLVIMAEWESRNGFTTRIANLSGLLNVGAVKDDGVPDELTGGLARDWYLDFALADTRVGFSSNPTTGIEGIRALTLTRSVSEG
jgi:uncharacterized repeat protein (TIGR01451 family)